MISVPRRFVAVAASAVAVSASVFVPQLSSSSPQTAA
jgi:hypothetical protein